MTSEWTKERIDEFAESIKQSASEYREEAVSWRRWAQASCLSINGAAIIAVLNLEGASLDDSSKYWSIGWFLAGVVASIVYGFVSAALWAKYAKLFRGSVKIITRKGRGEEGDERLDVKKLENLNKIDQGIQWIQYLALPLFVIGLAIVVEGLN